MGRRQIIKKVNKNSIKKVNKSSVKEVNTQSKQIKNNSDKKETLTKITINDLDKKIESLTKYFKKYPHEISTTNIKKIKENLNNQEYKIAVVANMSSGKSTFINALFGKEVLPAFNHATTDSATFIYSEPDIEKRAIIYFNDDKKQVEIKDDLEKEIKQYAQKDDDCNDNKYKNVEKIELFYPFKNLQTSASKDFKIIFIDTPGPNSTGEGYKQKHKDQTRSVLNDVDLALFMFDYGQVDTNLESDEQGLWNTIKKRKDDDKNFDVYFILNKIDYGIKDNDTLIKDEYDSLSREDFYRLKVEKWRFSEKKAIEKLRVAAIKHKIFNPKIFSISSMYQLLYRNNEDWQGREDILEPFQKSHFRNIFNNNWEKEFIKYIGISQLEEDINNYIESSVKNKILKKISSQLNDIEAEEGEKLEIRIQILEKPKKEAENNLNKATIFLEKEAINIENNFRKESKKIQEKYINLIKKIIDDRIEQELKKKIEEATDRTVKFLELLILDNLSVHDATTDAKNLPKDKLENISSNKYIEFSIDSKVEVDEMEDNLSSFVKSILNDYKNNYLDMKIDIKNNYNQLAKDVGTLFNNSKQKFSSELIDTLDIKNDVLDENILFSESFYDGDIEVPESTIGYKYQDAKWTEGGSFSSRKKTQNEKHEILINRDDIIKIFNLSIESMKRTYYSKEIQSYEKSIVEFIDSSVDKFFLFKEEKKKEIEKIKNNLNKSQESLKDALEQKKNLIEQNKEF